MTTDNKPQRVKLTIAEVLPVRTVGERKIPVLDFKADGVKYTIFGREALQKLVVAGAVLDCEVETKTREYNGNTYTDHNILNIFQDGQPVSKPGGGGRSFGRSPEERRSIERQCALKCSMEYLSSIPLDVDFDEQKVLAIAELFAQWIAGEPVKLVPEPAKSAPMPTTVPTTGKEATKGQKAGKGTSKRDPASIKSMSELYKACKDDFGMMPTDVFAELGVKGYTEIHDTPADCYLKIATARMKSADPTDTEEIFDK